MLNNITQFRLLALSRYGTEIGMALMGAGFDLPV